MGNQKPIRFGTGAGRPTDPARLVAAARRAEELGYSTFGMADHFMIPFAPLLGLQAAAAATTTLRITPTVLNHDFRHPGVLAKELATLDVLSGGRLEIGIGAGWMQTEYEQVGIHWDKASVRIERLEEVLLVLEGLFADGPFSFAGNHFSITELDGTPKPVQRPRPPIMIGGGGPKLLSVAARHADIIQVTSQFPLSDPKQVTAPVYREKIEWIRDAAGSRFDDIELGVQLLLFAITDDPSTTVETFLSGWAPVSGRLSGRQGHAMNLTEAELLASPVVAVGSLEQVCDKLLETRDVFGFSYFAGAVGADPAQLAPVINRVAGV
jgi:probable F420-dependent oxidoreductase